MVEIINKKIEDGYCKLITEKLEDLNLLSVYKESKSVQKKEEKIKNLLKNILEEEKIKEVLNAILPELIPPGTKGVIKGLKFNLFIKEKLESLKLDKEIYDLSFEKNHPFIETDEIPDWYIYNKENKKSIIGMNQLDLWSGGHQTNRAGKYILNNKEADKSLKFVCVVCKKIKIKKENNKVFNIFKVGFEKNILFYPNHLEKFIVEFFN